MSAQVDETFHDPVLQRMKADHDQASAGRHPRDRGFQGQCQFFKLLIDENAQGLKSARRRVLVRILAVFDGDRACHDLGKVGGALHRPACRLASHNRPCNRCSKPLIAIFAHHSPHLGQIRARQPLRCRLTGVRIHSHVERPVQPQRKAARRIVELR